MVRRLALSGSFYPAMFQAAIDAGRPVQPLRLTYHHVDGSVSTAPAFVGDDTLWRSIGRLLAVRRTLARVHVESLQLPGTDRRDLARRCQSAVGVGASRQRPGHGHVLVASEVWGPGLPVSWGASWSTWITPPPPRCIPPPSRR